MRGALTLIAGLHGAKGIIPADAGSTCRLATTPLIGGDHPRGCGEHVSG